MISDTAAGWPAANRPRPADIVIGIQKRVGHQLRFVRQEDRQTVWRPFVIVVDTGQILPFRLHNRTVAHRTRPGVDSVVRVHHARVVQVFNKLCSCS